MQLLHRHKHLHLQYRVPRTVIRQIQTELYAKFNLQKLGAFLEKMIIKLKSEKSCLLCVSTVGYMRENLQDQSFDFSLLLLNLNSLIISPLKAILPAL